MNVDLILQLVGAVIGGGVFTALTTYLLGKTKSKQDLFKEVVDRWKQDNERLRKNEGLLLEKVDNLQKDVNDLRLKLVMLESAQMSLPLPMWIKDASYRMMALNAAYEHMFLHPMGLDSGDYIGNTDESIWPSEISKTFKAHDKKVLSTKKPHLFKETWKIGDEEVEWRVLKYPRFFENKVIGVGGIAIPPIGYKF